MSDSMVERVARAIADASFEAEGRASLWPHCKEGWYPVARAAIAAMREPTEEMRQAQRTRAWVKAGAASFTDPDPADEWRAQIDAALAEKP